MRKHLVCIMALIVLHTSCVEPIDIVPGTTGVTSLEGLLIVEANITNVEKRQQVLLSRLRKIESDSTVNVREDRLFNATSPIVVTNGLAPDFESGALIEVMTSEGAVFSFQETNPGTYMSINSFSARPNVDYHLTIRTSDGTEYNSEPKQLPIESSLDRIYAERMVSDSGEEGVGIFVDSSFPNSAPKLLRYGFEETYKIIAPDWTPLEFEIIRDQIDFDQFGDILYPDVRTVPRAREERVCYNTDLSNNEILINGGTIEGNNLERSMVRFIGRSNPIISHRYSILVQQYSVSTESFQFYNQLSSFSQNESLFSQIQPGRLEGNVFQSGSESGVIGYFDVSHETSQRFYFNYEDFFANEPLPPYFGMASCGRVVGSNLGGAESFISPRLLNPLRDGPPPPPPFECPQDLITRIKLELVEYAAENPNPDICEGPYLVTFTICGDCNVVGSNVVPEFWIEE